MAEDIRVTKMDLSPEDRLLRICAQIEINNKSKNVLKEILHNNLNWYYIRQESIKQGITCLVYNSLSEFKYSVPTDVWNDFKEIYYMNVYRTTRAQQQLKTILSSFDKERLKVIPLKGILLAQDLYNNIALRGITDIDLLIKKKDLPKINEVLEGLGYTVSINRQTLAAAIEKSYLNSVDYFNIDKKMLSLHIHWHIVNVTLPTYMYSKEIKMDRFFESAAPTEFEDIKTFQLATHHLILYLSEHALKHSFDRLILLSDIDAVIKGYKEKIDWKSLLKETIEFGMQRQVFYSLYFTKYFLKTDIPDSVISSLKPKKTGFFEKRFFNSTLSNNRGTKLCYFVYLNMIKGAINKFRFIFRTLIPPPSVLALTFNLESSKVSIKDYLLYIKEQLFYLRRSLFSLKYNRAGTDNGCLIDKP